MLLGTCFAGNVAVAAATAAILPPITIYGIYMGQAHVYRAVRCAVTGGSRIACTVHACAHMRHVKHNCAALEAPDDVFTTSIADDMTCIVC